VSSLLDNLPRWPEDDFSAYGPVTSQPVGRFQQVTGGMLHRNWVAIPHVTHHDELDITDLETRRAAWNEENPGQKVTPLIPLIKATAATLGTFPQFRSSIEASGKTLIVKDYAHIGVAVETPNGLLVPVLRDCDTRGVQELAKELAAVSAQARETGLPMSAMAGGCITISSLGHIGGTGFTPIINAPQVAIIGVSRTQIRPRPAASPGGELLWRTMLPVSLSYDHRVINGADAARFCASLGEALAGISTFR
jgi:pyruvate dehydrogenase E2 component (dihydrolipoamide acetyltransferase)